MCKLRQTTKLKTSSKSCKWSCFLRKEISRIDLTRSKHRCSSLSRNASISRLKNSKSSRKWIFKVKSLTYSDCKSRRKNCKVNFKLKQIKYALNKRKNSTWNDDKSLNKTIAKSKSSSGLRSVGSKSSYSLWKMNLSDSKKLRVAQLAMNLLSIERSWSEMSKINSRTTKGSSKT